MDETKAGKEAGTPRTPDEVLTARQRQRSVDEQWPGYMGLLVALVHDKGEHQQVRFRGNVYPLIGDVETGGAIATAEQYENGEISFAHLQPDGLIARFGEQIGTLADLEFLPAPQAPPTPDGSASMAGKEK